MSAAVNNYTGEQTPEAAFQNVVSPITEEAGCHFTWEDYQKYLQEEVKSLDLDEMAQVAGGSSTRGTALSACIGIGFGGGATIQMDDDGTKLATVCLFVGFGESSACAYAGASTDYTRHMNPEWDDCAMHGA